MINNHSGQGTGEALDHPSVTASLTFLRQRYERRKCDSEAVADCVRCNVMFLVNKIEASRDTRKEGP